MEGRAAASSSVTPVAQAGSRINSVAP